MWAAVDARVASAARGAYAARATIAPSFAYAGGATRVGVTSGAARAIGAILMLLTPIGVHGVHADSVVCGTAAPCSRAVPSGVAAHPACDGLSLGRADGVVVVVEC